MPAVQLHGRYLQSAPLHAGAKFLSDFPSHRVAPVIDHVGPCRRILLIGQVPANAGY